MMADSEEKSNAICDEEELEDGEIEDDDENNDGNKDLNEVIVNKVIDQVPMVSKKPNKEEKKTSHESGSSSNSKRANASNKNTDNADDDFMSNIEAQIANVLKKEGVDPPMPNIKKHNDANDYEKERKSSSRLNASSRKRRKRKERDHKKDQSSSKKRSKIGDEDNLYMVGGTLSPDHQNYSSESDEGSSYSSYDSDDYRRSSYDERRNKRRDRYGNSRAERDRERNKDRKDRHNRDNEKEVCLRFSEYGHCPDEDCNRIHEVRQPKKMELCKFWLMECCAKKDKCSYMHGDFPCKFYYLGLKCINKDCKFMHGKPLTDNLKNILLKHLDTAPKEILGDFPRIGRDNASKMIAQTHVRLCEEFNIPCSDNEKNAAEKIPSLLDMKLKPPENIKKDSGRNSSRWKEANSTVSSSSATETTTKGPGDVLLSKMSNILSEQQISNMSKIGVKTVNHINNLTVAQLNDIGLSLATIGEIQATAINMHNSESSDSKEPDTIFSTTEDTDLRKQQFNSRDIDMRIFTSNNNSSQQPSDEIKSPSNASDKANEAQSQLASPPIDYSQYLRESNLNSCDENENEDEMCLKIDETYGSDEEIKSDDNDKTKDELNVKESDEMTSTSSLALPLLPPSIDTSSFLKITSKVDLSSSVQQIMESERRDPRTSNLRDPRNSKSPPKESIPEISSPTYRDPRQQPKEIVSKKTCIYEIESPSQSEDEGLVNFNIRKDKDMRLSAFSRDSENGDIDLRFPFTPMTSYVPATEIEASYGTYHFDKYEVKIVDIPRPDYSDIRRNFRQVENTQDPRVKKICKDTASATTTTSTLPSDPRKRKNQEDSQKAAPTVKKLQISTILQNSKHYNELSSSQKMIVNDVLSELSKDLKLFHADTSPNKIFDASRISSNPRLQQILIGLGVFVNAEGEFEEIKEFSMPIAAPTQVINIPTNIHQMPPTIIPPSLLQQPPPNLMLQPPPNFPAGIIPFPFDANDPYSSRFNNNEQSNFNRTQNTRQHQSNNFRNNNFRNNNNNRR